MWDIVTLQRLWSAIYFIKYLFLSQILTLHYYYSFVADFQNV